jgi:HNH endonuclease
MYLQNKYTIWYHLIIDNARSRTLSQGVYIECHHIIPRSLGGTDDSSNLVKLTAREHFICHLLLTKMVEGNSRRAMSYALWGMMNQKNSYQDRYIINNSKLYEYARGLANESQRVMRMGKTLEEIYGVEIGSKMREKFKTRKSRSTPTIDEKIEISQRIKNASKNRPWTRNFEFGQPDKKQCPVCQMTVDVGNYSRHHGSNCKRVNKECICCNTPFQTTKHENKMYCSKECYFDRLKP